MCHSEPWIIKPEFCGINGSINCVSALESTLKTIQNIKSIFKLDVFSKITKNLKEMKSYLDELKSSVSNERNIWHVTCYVARPFFVRMNKQLYKYVLKTQYCVCLAQILQNVFQKIAWDLEESLPWDIFSQRLTFANRSSVNVDLGSDEIDVLIVRYPLLTWRAAVL